ncbi:hypothetical protein TVAG_166500 [Trichomonas vaginalis G3]|uniref:Uncharacterized protein n=1 Tax=Trichomonas vaginalis (strain ATCC PRA-98 / G3) TaxID=412133 RepID=A2DE57_TRIV3|nr:hypothetical protein TVAGG3_0174630 [Trichomonas vaginalis G3]EAY21275.1 hypothetical protein TVAG_166500 [Trichomonas vaginalis G3]KAI5548849.1 hypothetical protein TVAGG3_0174630 [Trichomonas vaginalis G3]|eukprot:XP_001582261.1 hypothetical protein [Trichomonas vaginalis G3]
MEELAAALQGAGDPEKCIDTIAQNMPEFVKNDEFLNMPVELIDIILQNPHINFPDPMQTSEFFVKMFSKGKDTAQYFSDHVPIEIMTKESIIPLIEKLESLGLQLEAKRFKRILNLHQKIEQKETEVQSALLELETITNKVTECNKHLCETRPVLVGMDDAMRIMNDELEAQQKRLAATEREIIKLQKKSLTSRK